MKIRDASLLAARLLALFLVVDALRYLGLVISRLLVMPVGSREWVEALAFPVVTMVAGAILWITARSFAESVALDAIVLSDAEDSEGEEDDPTAAPVSMDAVDGETEYVHRIEIDDDDDDDEAEDADAPADVTRDLSKIAAWMMLGIVLIGVWAVARALPQLVYSISTLSVQDSANRFGEGFAEQQRTEAIRQILNSFAQIAVGVILVVGKVTLVRWLMNLRSPSSSQPIGTDAD